MPGVNVVVGNDGVNNLSGSAGNDLIYGFDPNGPQSDVNSIAATRVATGLIAKVESPLDRLSLPKASGRKRSMPKRAPPA